MRPRARFLLAALLLLPLVAPSAPAASETPARLEWVYRVSIPDPSSGSVHVELAFRGLEGSVSRVTLLTLDHADPVTNVRGVLPGTPLTTENGGVSFAVDDPEERVSFDVRVRREAFRPGEYLAWSGPDFAVFKAESLALAYTYTYFEGRPFEWSASVEFDLPPAWHAAAPWARSGPDRFLLAPGDVLPRGYVALGPFAVPAPIELADGRRVSYARLGATASFERDLVDYADKALPFFEAVYGPVAGDDLLVVSAPDPMFRGGLGAVDSVFLHESADLRTLAHELAHAHQRFAVEERAGASAIWFSEGDADHHGALSLFAAQLLTVEEVASAFARADAARDEPAFASGALVHATYGTALERLAYDKGATVVRALDRSLRDATGGAAGVSDLLRRLNARRASDDGAPPAVTNADILQVAGEIAGRNLSDSFASFVQGTEWPEPRPFEPEGALALSDLRLEPAKAAPGDAVVATLLASNAGAQPLRRALSLHVDNAVHDTKEVVLPIGATERVTFSFLAPEPGEHEARVATLRAEFRSLAEPQLRVGRVTFAPETVRAGEDVRLVLAIENAGELPGSATVSARVGERRLASPVEVFVDGESSQSASLPVRFPTSGSIDLVLRLTTPDGRVTERIEPILVQSPDVDRDGVSDALDDYPENPDLSSRSAGNDVRNLVPGSKFVAALAAVLVCAWVMRRSR